MAATRRMLISYAHPDDESFGLGALIAKYVAQGIEMYLICATNGDAGTVDPKYLEGYDSVAARRIAELNCANEILKFRQMFLFGYRDSGMMGTPDNDHPDSLWQAYQNTPDEVTRRVVEVIRQVRPQVVLTFNEYGGYGHPDHIAIQRATVAALQVANDDHYLTDGLLPYQPQKLYYSALPRRAIQFRLLTLRLQGKDPRKQGRNGDIDMVAIGEHATSPTTLVNIAGYYDEWDAASACHPSQGGGGSFRGPFPKSWRRYTAPNQGFTRVFPAPGTSRVDEHDLFTGVTADEPLAVPTA